MSKSSKENSLVLHNEGVKNLAVCECAYSVVITVGTVPVNVPSGARYLTVYKSGL